MMPTLLENDIFLRSVRAHELVWTLFFNTINILEKKPSEGWTRLLMKGRWPLIESIQCLTIVAKNCSLQTDQSNVLYQVWQGTKNEDFHLFSPVMSETF